ncbi:hypothetical protein BT69DRAFT_1286887 [Atractiella rhizophila]|nr:hypothetical protein BT69DRAFT_1286887 [Atractiella rhizophila]
MSRSPSPVDQLQTLPSEDVSLRKENTVLRERVNVLENEVVTLRAEVVTLTTKGDKLLVEGDKLRAEVVTLRSEGDQLRVEGDKLRAEGDKLRAEGDKLRVEVDTLKENNSQLNGRMENLEQQLKLVFQRASGNSGGGDQEAAVQTGGSDRGLSSHHSHLGSHHGSHPSSLVPTEPVPESRDAPPGTPIEHIILSSAMKNLTITPRDV